MTTEVEDGELDDANANPASTLKNVTKENSPGEAKQAQSPAPNVKSDVLTRRDQIREAASKAPTPTPSQTSMPTRPESSRTGSSNPLAERPSRNLPSRPEGPLPSRQELDRHTSSRYGDRRDGRDPRQVDHGRSERPGERREYAGSERPIPRDAGRANVRRRCPPVRPKWHASSDLISFIIGPWPCGQPGEIAVCQC